MMSQRRLLAFIACLGALAAIGLGLTAAYALTALVVALLAILLWSEDRSADGQRMSAGSREFDVEPNAAPKIKALINAFELPALLLDANLDVLAHNSSSRELFPQLREGEPLSPVVRNPELLNAAKATLQSKTSHTVQILNRVPFERRLLATLVPIDTEQRDVSAGTQTKPFMIFLQIRDLTEQSRLAQMRSDFIANASHELRTPLASLRGFIETLRGPARNDAAAHDKFLTIMDEQAARMNRILDDLLSLSRIEMRAHLFPETTVDLADIVVSVVRGLEPLAKDAKINIHCKDPPDPINVGGDRVELEQVFQNLVHNAIKYGREGGNVDIIFERRADRGVNSNLIAVTVADDGYGISEEHLPRLTERFYRVDTVASRQRGGTGLGLAIVKHILTRHRGELEISSQPGTGSRFTVLLNLAQHSRVGTESHHRDDPTPREHL